MRNAKSDDLYHIIMIEHKSDQRTNRMTATRLIGAFINGIINDRFRSLCGLIQARFACFDCYPPRLTDN